MWICSDFDAVYISYELYVFRRRRYVQGVYVLKTADEKTPPRVSSVVNWRCVDVVFLK